MKTLLELVNDINVTQAALDCADKECAVTSGKRTDAINRANNAQKEFDLYIAQLKSSASRSTDWGKPR